MHLLVVAALAASFADAGNLRSMPAVTSTVIEELLQDAVEGRADGEASAHVQRLEKELRPIYDALPKNEKGRLNHASVRYVLHRFFMQKFTWFVRGLEPGDAAPAAVMKTDFGLNSGTADAWPSFLQGKIEKTSVGLNLRGIASLAAAMEELDHYDVRNRLSMAYDGLKFGRDAKLDAESVALVLKEYMLLYTSGWNMTAMTEEQLQMEERKHFSSHRWTNMFMPWLQNLQTEVTSANGLASSDVTFDDVSSLAGQVGRRFFELNNQDCSDLKNTLVAMEDRKPGRVRLSDFYNKSRFSKFAFTEKIDYLRSLGALDETNVTNPLVIVTNYVTSMPQCLKASSLYTVCCPNECETLMGSIENAIAAPEAKPDRISSLVAALSTNTVTVPRELSDNLLKRLEEIASQHGGKVQLHGRLFAQWLHHAFPRECPWPHQASTTNPLTPDEWMEKSSQSATDASEEEMIEHIRLDDTCPLEGCAESDNELPWHADEELVHAREVFQGTSEESSKESEMKTLLEGVDDMAATPASSRGFTFLATIAAGLSALGVAAAVRSHRFSTVTGGTQKKKGYAQEVVWHGSGDLPY
jgi:hypothetical protein